MDPGTALAVTSLVIDLSKDFYEFYRAWKNCPEDVAQLRQQLLEQKGMFLVLRATLQRHDVDADKLQLLANAARRCAEPAERLREMLDKFPQADEAASMREKLRSQARRVFFPFRQKTIGELQEHLETCRDELQGAVGVVNLDATLGLSQQVRELDEKLVNNSDKLDDVADNLRVLFARMMQDLSAGAARTQASFNNLEAEKRWKDLMEWLSPTDYSQLHNDYYASRTPHTGDWIFASDEFAQWSQNSSSVLICHGEAGAGKTVMAATVIDSLLQSNDVAVVATIYVYFNYKRVAEQNTFQVLCALLRQLVWFKKGVPESLGKLYDHHNSRSSRPTLQDIEKELSAAIATFTQVNVVVDALDECHDDFREEVIIAIKKIQQHNKAHVLITSRSLPVVMNHIVKHLEHTSNIEIRASESDLSLYLRAQLTRFPESTRESKQLQDRIVTSIVSAVKGIFLLARLFMAHFSGIDSRKELRLAVEQLETQSHLKNDMYDSAYDSAMKRLAEQPRPRQIRALEALAWVTYSRRQLTPLELEYALAIELDDHVHDLDEENIVSCKAIISYCAGLLVEDVDAGVIRLVHFTTQAYLERKFAEELQNGPEPEPFTWIATKCLRYLSFDTYTADAGKRGRPEAMIARHPFLAYAATYWGHHFRQSEDQHRTEQDVVRLTELAVSLLSCPDKVYNLAQFIFEHNYKYEKYWDKIQASHILAFLGLATIMEHMLCTDLDLDSMNLDRRTPLALAAIEGHGEVVEILVRMRDQVDVNSRGYAGDTPLILAAEDGHEAIVRMLLAADQINVNASSYSSTALSLAALNGHKAIVQLLLRADQIEINLGEPLALAAQKGHEAIVQMFLKADQIDVNAAKSGSGRTPLSLAAEFGHEATVQMLLGDDRIDVHTFDYMGQTPLSLAAQDGNMTNVRLLLAAGQIELDHSQATGTAGGDHNLIESPFRHGGDRMCSVNRALVEAAINGHTTIVKILLDVPGVDINYRTSVDKTPLFCAAAGGHVAIVELLLAFDSIDVNLRGVLGMSPLLVAARWGHKTVIRLLLETGRVDIDLPDEDGRTPLSWAAENGHEAIVKLLLAKNNGNINTHDEQDRCALSLLAAKHGKAGMVKLLQETKQADANIRDASGRMVISWAAGQGEGKIL